jgi:hypothetical protein
MSTQEPKSTPPPTKGSKSSSNLAVYVILGVGLAYLIVRLVLFLKAGE